MSTGICSVFDKRGWGFHGWTVPSYRNGPITAQRVDPGAGDTVNSWHAPHLEVVTTGLWLNYCTKRLCLYPVRFYVTHPQQQQGRDCVLL